MKCLVCGLALACICLYITPEKVCIAAKQAVYPKTPKDCRNNKSTCLITVIATFPFCPADIKPRAITVSIYETGSLLPLSTSSTIAHMFSAIKLMLAYQIYLKTFLPAHKAILLYPPLFCIFLTLLSTDVSRLFSLISLNATILFIR